MAYDSDRHLLDMVLYFLPISVLLLSARVVPSHDGIETRVERFTI